jgi:exodeoxyribonuclease VII large subunit
MPLPSRIAPENTNLDSIDSGTIYSVTDLSRNIKAELSADPQFKDIFIRGEISNFAKASSGHIYFNLLEDNCVIACALFRHFQETDYDNLGDGLQVVAMGSINVYEPRSQYQLSIKKIVSVEDGVSSRELQRLKEKLDKEGLFDQGRKKPIPLLPRKVGVITSKDSAAITDILSVISSRFPKMDIVMTYATLQGENASSSIIKALSHLIKANDVDSIILARGGGSSEDFKALNDEALVRAIATSPKPIITGIGHERDTCLADLAADFRASTPSTAAKAAIPDVQELRSGLNSLVANLDRSYDSYLMSREIKEKEAKIDEKEMEMEKVLDGGSSDIIKYKIIILALAALLVLIILIFWLRV